MQFPLPNFVISKAGRLSVVAGCLMMVAAGCQAAEEVYFTNFKGNQGPVPLDLKVYSAPSMTVELDGAGQLVFALTGEGAVGSAGAVYFEGDSAATTANLHNSRVTAILQFAGNFYRRGVVLRGQSFSPDLADPNGYYACVYRSGEKDYLEITKDPKGAKATSLRRIELPMLENGRYHLVFEAIDDQLIATLFDASGHVEIGHATAFDESYQAGLSGIRSYINSYNSNRHALPAFSQFSIEKL